MRNFQILVVSAVKYCKQCLQTVSASGGPTRPTGALPWPPLGYVRPQTFRLKFLQGPSL